MNSSWYELLEHTKSHQYQTSDEQTQVRDALLILDIIKMAKFLVPSSSLLCFFLDVYVVSVYNGKQIQGHKFNDIQTFSNS